jgi:DNA-binding NarL/FixJ family response regulator
MKTAKKTILLVDDSPLILDRLIMMLKKLDCAGDIHSAQTFSAAIQLLDTKTVDIALFDIHLHDKSGIDLLRETREQHPAVVVIVLTNQADEQVEQTCKKLGARYFLDKSKDFAQVPHIISSLV